MQNVSAGEKVRGWENEDGRPELGDGRLETGDRRKASVRQEAFAVGPSDARGQRRVNRRGERGTYGLRGRMLRWARKREGWRPEWEDCG